MLLNIRICRQSSRGDIWYPSGGVVRRKYQSIDHRTGEGIIPSLLNYDQILYTLIFVYYEG